MDAFGHVGDTQRMLHIGRRFEDAAAIAASTAIMLGVVVGGPVAFVGLLIPNVPTIAAGAAVMVGGFALAAVVLSRAPPPAGYLLEPGVQPKLDAYGLQVTF